MNKEIRIKKYFVNEQEENEYILTNSLIAWIKIDDLEDNHFENKNELTIFQNPSSDIPIKIYKTAHKYFIKKGFKVPNEWAVKFDTLEDLKTHLKSY